MDIYYTSLLDVGNFISAIDPKNTKDRISISAF
jgi:hypothetical protein